jgi:putative endonuclease
MPPGPPYYVYLLSNRRRTVLYVGMTNGLRRRLQEHRTGHGSAFVDRYNTTDLLYFERHDPPQAAIEREKQIKRWRREKKEALVRTANPDLESLSPPVD